MQLLSFKFIKDKERRSLNPLKSAIQCNLSPSATCRCSGPCTCSGLLRKPSYPINAKWEMIFNLHRCLHFLMLELR